MYSPMCLIHNMNKASYQCKVPLTCILHAKIILVWKLHLTINLWLSINLQHVNVHSVDKK